MVNSEKKIKGQDGGGGVFSNMKL